MNTDTNRAAFAAATKRVRDITDRAVSEGRGLTDSEQVSVDSSLAEAENLNTRAQADKARAKFSAVIGPRADDKSIGNWVEERVLNNATQAGFAPYAWRPSVVAALTGTSVAQAAGFVVEYLADGLGDRLYIPAITQVPSATLTYGTASALGTATASDPTITAGAVQTDRVQALSLADNTILADAPPRYFNDLGNALVTSVSEKIDAVIFAGGSYTTAIGSVSGIGTVSMGTNGATIASTGVDPFITAYGTAVQAGARPSVWVMNAAAYTSLLKVKSLTTGSNTPLLFSNALSSVAGAVPYTLMGLPILVTSGTATIGNGETAGTATNTTSAYLLDSSKISLLYRTESTGGEPITLTADRSRYFVENQTAILATARVGLRVTQPAAVTRITGIIA